MSNNVKFFETPCISQLVGQIKGFCKKLMLLRDSFQRNDATHFPSCSKLLGEEKTIDFSAFSEKISDINNEFNDRFAESKNGAFQQFDGSRYRASTALSPGKIM